MKTIKISDVPIGHFFKILGDECIRVTGWGLDPDVFYYMSDSRPKYVLTITDPEILSSLTEVY